MDLHFEEDFSQGNSPIERKTAIEWEDERSEEESDSAGGNAVQDASVTKSKQQPAPPILCFDAYGNLTSQTQEFREPEVSQQLNDLDSYLRITSASFQASSSDDDGVHDPTNNFSKLTVNKKQKPKKKIRISDSQLKQVIREDVQESVSTSRYGRERKKRTSDGFLFGTINFNELRRVTSTTTTIPAISKNKPDVEEFPGMNFLRNLDPFPDLAPGNAPPEKILASLDSLSETEDLNDNSLMFSKNVKKSKSPKHKSLPLSENIAVENKPTSMSHKKSQKRKISVDNKNKQVPSELSNENHTKFLSEDNVSEAPPPKKSKLNKNPTLSDTKKTDSKKENETVDATGEPKKKNEAKKSKENMVNDDNSTKKPKASEIKSHAEVVTRTSRRSRGTIVSDEEMEVSFTPRKKKRKTVPIVSDDEDKALNCSVDNNMSNLNVSSSHVSNLFDKPSVDTEDTFIEDEELKPKIDLGTVGDIADDLRLLKDLTEKSKIEPSTPETIKPTTTHRGRGRPRKSTTPAPSIADTTTPSKRTCANLNMSTSNQPEVNIKIENEDIGNGSVEEAASSPTSVTKRGRLVKRPDHTDISKLEKQQEKARQLHRSKQDTPKIEVSK